MATENSGAAETKTPPSLQLKFDDDKVEAIKKRLRKRKTFKSGRDRYSLWRRRWVLVKTLESSFSARSWVRADNDLSNSDSDALENPDAAAKQNGAGRGAPFTFFMSARRKAEFKEKGSLRDASGGGGNQSDVKGGLPHGWVTRRKRGKKWQSEGSKDKTEHACSVCKKVYPDVCSLKKHKRIHGEKKHACPEKGCPKAFSEASKLKRHMMVHTGEKPFTCPYPSCRRDFGLNYNLRKHIQQIHTGELLACCIDGCDRKFMDQNALRTHIKYYHNKDDADGEFLESSKK